MADTHNLIPPAVAAKAARRKKAPQSEGPDPAAAIVAALEALASGSYNVRVDTAAIADPALQHIAVSVNSAADHTAGQLLAAQKRIQGIGQGIDEAIEAVLKLIVQGDVTGQLKVAHADPVLAPLTGGVGQMMTTLKSFVLEIRDAALQLSASASEVLAAATENETSTTEQASAVHETTATIAELQGASNQIAENAQTVASIAEQTLGAARDGEGAIRAFIEAMDKVRANATDVSELIDRLSRRVERIGTVVEVIDEIADRSDLLALNAALEGAKAGDAGKGFSIVAAEMRRLAENVIESTKEIKNLITEIREATHSTKMAADANRQMAAQGEKLGSAAIVSVGGILSRVKETSDSARVIHLATQQQRTANEQVAQSMSEIETVARQAQAGSRQATEAAAELTKLAERLAALVQRFKVE